MQLAPGTRLGPYEIVAPLGAGGMGEVYRARDTRLGRDVAVKVLPQHLSANPEVRARFEREAKTVSSLNHPSICTLFDVGREGDTDFLVMELVDGETLASRIMRGPLPGADVLRIGAEIANALERAHRAGVVHRDLKPGNVMVTKSGVKLMDFGLARGRGPSASSGSDVTMAALTQSPTVGRPLTAEGTIVGTFQYMAPEQLEGSDPDTRSDVWALGCVLYEMATGRHAFAGKSQASLISHIMSAQPSPISELAPLSPPGLDRVVAQCLAKDPDERLQSAHDVRLALDMVRDSSFSGTIADVPRRAKRTGVAPALVAAGLVAAVAAGIALDRWVIPEPHVEPPGVRIIAHSGADQQPVASPDGKTMVFVSTRSGKSQIWLKQMASGDEVALTEGEDNNPHFSPDGSQVLFNRLDADGIPSLWRVSVVGGQPRQLVHQCGEGVISPDGRHLAFLRTGDPPAGGGEIWLANADGSQPRRFYSNPLALRWLSWSPDSRRLMASSILLGGGGITYVLVPINGDSVETVRPGSTGLTSNPVWLGAGDRIAYAMVEALATSATGQASRIVEHSLKNGKTRELLSLPNVCSDLAVLGDGKLLIGLAQVSQDLVLIDGAGTSHATEKWLTRGASTDRQPVFSPDETHIMFSSNRSGNLDLWEMDLASGNLVRVTDDPANDWDPAYTPDGNSILWSSDRSGVFEIWMASRSGAGARQISQDGFDAENPTTAGDGQWVVYLSGKAPDAGVWKMHPDGSDATLLVRNLNLPQISPAADVFAAPEGVGRRTGRVLRVYRISDGSPWPWEITLPLPFSSAVVGRPRWAGAGRLAFTNIDSSGRAGVSLCDVSARTIGPQRAWAGFDPLTPTESFDISDDASRVVLSVQSSIFSIAVAENVKGVSR